MQGIFRGATRVNSYHQAATYAQPQPEFIKRKRYYQEFLEVKDVHQ
ncbi:MAG: hypothetical protein U1E05_09495 [Patescibacteria group bacterium]|nr:hypothetical protein [Patescibacteria group bacterium]